MGSLRFIWRDSINVQDSVFIWKAHGDFGHVCLPRDFTLYGLVFFILDGLIACGMVQPVRLSLYFLRWPKHSVSFG